MVFQYPLSDRTHCNSRGYRGTVGVVLTFSILYRIELTVTPTRMHNTLLPKTFSILYRIELTVTVGTFALARPGIGFQYPLSDRTHCNRVPIIL